MPEPVTHVLTRRAVLTQHRGQQDDRVIGVGVEGVGLLVEAVAVGFTKFCTSGRGSPGKKLDCV
jgi:hypothetical protein